MSIRSALALPELRPAVVAGGEADLTIAPAGQDARLPDVDGTGLLIGHTPEEIVLRWPRFGTYRVQQGRRIEYAPPPGLSSAAVRVPLLGVCMGLLLHQRGTLTLHASAVAISGGAVVFVGEKGAGKSTTVAALAERGHRLLSDDVVAIDGSGEGLQVRPGFSAVKLWPDSVAALGVDPEGVPLLHEDVEKRVLRFSGPGRPSPLPLRCVYVLEPADSVSSAALQPQEAFSELTRHTYAVRFLGAAAIGPRHFRQCTSLIQHVPLRRLGRTHDVRQLNQLVEKIEAEWER